MEEETLVNNLSKLADKFYQTERLQKETNAEYLKWIQQISKKSYKLIYNLITYFKEDGIYQKTKEIIIFILLKLLQLNTDKVKPQLFNDSFIQSLIKYIRYANQSNLNQNVFHLITLLFAIDNLKQYLKDDLIIGLLNGLNIITDKKVIEDVIYMIAHLSYLYPQGYKNGVMKVLHRHPNALLFNELSIGIFHYEKDNKKQIKILQLINLMLQKEKKATFLDVDFKHLIDILLIQLVSSYPSDDLRTTIVGSLKIITKDVDYYNESQYKIEDIINVMDDIKCNEKHPENLRESCKDVMDNITKNLAMQGN